MKRIMFNSKYGLTDAVISGRKTMTRRPCTITITERDTMKDVTIDNIFLEDGIWMFTFRNKTYPLPRRDLPKYEVGDIVAVLQNYASIPDISDKLLDEVIGSLGMTNKMYVKAEHMPYKIEITSIKAERLQDISDDDCLREGVQKNGFGYHVNGLRINKETDACILKAGESCKLFQSARQAFHELIVKVSGRDSWEQNKWQWVYEFKIINNQSKN